MNSLPPIYDGKLKIAEGRVKPFAFVLHITLKFLEGHPPLAVKLEDAPIWFPTVWEELAKKSRRLISYDHAKGGLLQDHLQGEKSVKRRIILESIGAQLVLKLFEDMKFVSEEQIEDIAQQYVKNAYTVNKDLIASTRKKVGSTVDEKKQG